jgi:hypothetical protein
MRSKPFQWLAATALLLTCSVPVWAQPELVGEEFQVNQNKDSRQLQPVALFNASGNAMIVWENDIHGILGRFYDRNGAASGEITLVANRNLPGIPARGEVLVRKDPAVLSLPNGEMLVFWTEEKDYLSIDHFYENRKMLDQDVMGQRFDAAGAPLGERFLINAATEGFQRHPKAALKAGGVVVVWESSADGRSSSSVQGRLLTRRGKSAGDEFRVDAGRVSPIWNLALAANAAGDFLVAWESKDADGPGVAGRLYDKDGAALGAEFGINARTAGRQRRPAVLATRAGDFLVAWQGYQEDVDHGIYGQLISRGGARIGGEVQIGHGTGEVQVAPSLALLPSGGIVAAWMDWVGTWPSGVYAVTLDASGHPTGGEVLVSEERLYPQYRISVAAGAASTAGDVVATWEGRLSRGRAITARRLQVN